MQAAPPGFVLDLPTILAFTFPESGIPPGTYYLFAALVRQGALQDDLIDPGDVLGLDIRTFVFSP